MGLSSFNAMRARERARLQAQSKVEEKTVEVETKTVEVETKTELTSDENLIESEKTVEVETKTEKKKTDAEKLKKKGM